MVGISVTTIVGLIVVMTVGFIEGNKVGISEGIIVGWSLEGFKVGSDELGPKLGNIVGVCDGT